MGIWAVLALCQEDVVVIPMWLLRRLSLEPILILSFRHHCLILLRLERRNVDDRAL